MHSLETRQRKIAELTDQNEQIARDAHDLQEKVQALNEQILKLKQDSELNDSIIAELKLEGDRIAE